MHLALVELLKSAHIASTCLETGAEIYHNDGDFDALARVSDLAIYRPA